MKIEFVDGVWIVTLTGEHGLVNVEELRATLRCLFAPRERPASQPTVAVVDLTHVAFFDSSVATAIMAAHDVTERDSDLELALVVESAYCFAARLLRTLGMTTAVPTFTDRTAVLSALAQRRAPATHTQSSTTRERLAFMAGAFKAA